MLVNEQDLPAPDATSILHPSSRTLFRFWETTRGANAAPRRVDLDLKQIHGLVPNLLVAERDERSLTYRWRLAGTGICELYQRELTGTGLLDGWDAFETGVISRYLDGVVRNLQPCLLRFRLRTDLDQEIGAEMISLPLLASDGRTIHILGGLFPFREIWSLAHGRIAGMQLSAARSIWTEHLPGDHLLPQGAETADNRPFRPFQVITGGLGFE